MAKGQHEIRDPIHVFVRLSSGERAVLDSRPFQRLRHIHQLAMTYLVYPGATHKRFEHSLGVMELASRVFDVVTRQENVSDEVQEQIPELSGQHDHIYAYWRTVVRMAALCHDIGHLPFSHAAEKELLPTGWTHERLTAELVRSSEMSAIWDDLKINANDVLKVALGPKEATKVDKAIKFSFWETLLSEVIVGDALGADRMDYLLRDSYHAGVAYGRFDHYRLIDTMRLLPSPSDGAPALGIEEGGLQSAEGLMLARYFMYSQVYFHPIRRIYDVHLKDFLKTWLPDGQFSTDIRKHLELTDNEVNSAIMSAAHDSASQCHEPARVLVKREHFKDVYQRAPSDVEINPEAGRQIFDALCEHFGAEHFRHDRYKQRGGAPDFPVRLRDGRIASSMAMSGVLREVPVVSTDYVFADRATVDKAKSWLGANRKDIVKAAKEGD